MSPSAISTTPPNGMDKTTDLAASAIEQKIAETAPALSKIASDSKLAPLDASKLKFTRNTTPKTLPALDDPIRNTSSFCTDHMITAVWSASTGWAAPELKPYGPFSIMPNASVLHYATECFEGMKAYRGFDGALRLFRPDCNTRRMLTSATRISLPAFEPSELEKLIVNLMAIDGAKFLPEDQPGKFIYIRPTMIGTHAGLGVQIPSEAMLYVIATYMPVLSEPTHGMKLLASQNDMVRAWPGGFGYAKVGANYGPSLIAQQEAKSRGYDQVLWLLGNEGSVTEAGASNFFVVWKSKEGKLQLVTAPLADKIILDGVTRRSVLQLVRERLSDNKTGLQPLEIVERKYTMTEVAEAYDDDRIVEAFACGTAFFVVGVSDIHHRGKDLKIPVVRGNAGEYATLIKSWLKNIMYGKEQHEWGYIVEPKETL
ncbi:MAG: hypothetical protein M1818_005363 [Claussenomyces sp. TS43310]|nr:MAG: hypothetical protein M1818_005363 [Claussenomyces sp. TS43310]